MSEVDLVVGSVTSDDSVLMTLMDAIRTVAGAEAAESTALYEHIDPDLLEWIIDGSNEDVRVTFAHGGCDVLVQGDGMIVVSAHSTDPAQNSLHGMDHWSPSDERSDN